jgi:Bacterial Ig-like domain (group 3)
MLTGVQESVRLVRRVVLLVPLAVLLLGLVSTSVSHAALYFPLVGNRTVFGSSSTYAAVDEANFTMAPGEIRRVTDQLDISSRTGKGPEVDNKVICLDQNSNIIGPPGTPPVPFSNENYAAGGAGTGTNYSQDHGHAYQWNVATLIEAPPQNPTENYFCLLLARIDPPYRMTVLAPTTGETKYGTWLEVSAQNEAGAQQLQAPYCNSPGTDDYPSECSYIGPARLHDPTGLRNPPALNVTWQPVDTWTAANYATTIDGIATFQITSCYHGTASCVPSEWGYTGFLKCLHHRCGDAAGTSHLDIDQLYPDGSVCKVNRAFSERVTGRGRVFLSESYDISNKQHHLPLYYHVRASVSQNCGGSRRFKVVLHIRWTDGNPVKIDGGNVNLLNAPPPPRPKPTSVTLSCPGTGSPGSPIGLSGALSPALGNRPITITVGNAASGRQTATTQADGSYSLSYTPSQAGQYTFVASYGGESGYEASSSQQCTVTVTSPPPGATATSLTLTCPSSSYTPGSAIPLSGALNPPLSNRTITITVSGAASSSIATTTRSDGSYTASYTPSHDGQYTFVASYAGEPGYQPSSSPPCTVQVITP